MREILGWTLTLLPIVAVLALCWWLEGLKQVIWVVMLASLAIGCTVAGAELLGTS